MHDTAAADRDLKVFQTLSKNAPTGPYPYEHLFDYLDNSFEARAQVHGRNWISPSLTMTSRSIPISPKTCICWLRPI